MLKINENIIFTYNYKETNYLMNYSVYNESSFSANHKVGNKHTRHSNFIKALTNSSQTPIEHFYYDKSNNHQLPIVYNTTYDTTKQTQMSDLKRSFLENEKRQKQLISPSIRM